jgi:hypothetical protein
MASPQSNELAALAAELEDKLMKEYGPLMTGAPLTAALGYPSQDSFRQAVAQHSLPVAVFLIEKRRGKFALSQDVARWLAERRLDGHADAGKHRSTQPTREDVPM